MISAETNERMTRVGPGTPGGKLLRMYWQPVALVDELAGPHPVKKVRLLGEDLVLFKDESDRYGLLDRHCAHRGADLTYGRREDGGLRCPFHGWLFDAEGRCLETPAEPASSRLCQNVRQKAYPVVERSGILWTYMGEGQAPALPDFDCLVAPDAYTFAFKGFVDCNWLQILEVGVDPAHASFLHRYFEDADPKANYARPFRGTSADSDMPISKVLREYDKPTIDLLNTDYGLRICTRRRISDVHTHIRVTHLAFPQAFVIPLNAEMTISQWHVPVDDTTSYWYAIFTSFGAPVDKKEMRDFRLKLYELPDYMPRTNRANNYNFNPAEHSQTYLGMGEDVNVHDQWAVESQGKIHDRTKEHLGYSDRAIVAMRKLLLGAIDQVEKGERPMMALDRDAAQRVTGPMTVDGIGPTADWESYWRETYAKVAAGSTWAKGSTRAA